MTFAMTLSALCFRVWRLRGVPGHPFGRAMPELWLALLVLLSNRGDKFWSAASPIPWVKQGVAGGGLVSSALRHRQLPLAFPQIGSVRV